MLIFLPFYWQGHYVGQGRGPVGGSSSWNFQQIWETCPSGNHGLEKVCWGPLCSVCMMSSFLLHCIPSEVLGTCPSWQKAIFHLHLPLLCHHPVSMIPPAWQQNCSQCFSGRKARYSKYITRPICFLFFVFCFFVIFFTTFYSDSS